ncbi:MAG: TetR/AcrR family transcriptional regulator [Moraxellaceae bacterium]|jgi:AcrR family transcriptional regulator|nr:TetR/AcrR family transcriptional regulator [Moraxellaceae bacterium]
MARDDILKRAFAAFARDGYDGVSLRQLATTCCISDSLLSHHFGSKQQLWYEATDSVFAPLYRQLVNTLERIEAENVAWKLRRNLKASLTMLGSQPDVIAFMFREGEGENERADHLRQHYVDPYTSRIHALVDEAAAQGLMRQLSHEACTGMVFGIMRMIAMPGVYKHVLAPRLASPESVSAYVDEVVSIFYDGLMLPMANGLARTGENTP